MATYNWKELFSRKSWAPIVLYVIASVLNLSQKHSPLAVNLLLALCTLYTWACILASKWWVNATGWRSLVRAIAPLIVLIILFWSATVFFRPKLPPKSYPWLSTNTFIRKGAEPVKAVRLHVFVREDPPSADSKKDVAALSSLYDLSLRILTPEVVTPNGVYSCSVGQPLKSAEWNNSDATWQPVATFELERETNVLTILGSSRNATWTGTVLVHSNGDWEESLGGWVKTDSGNEPVMIKETRKGNVTSIVTNSKESIGITPEQLVKYGVPFKEKLDGYTCPQATS
jgi:hypothetical protein